MTRRRSTTSITLVLIGSATLSSCGDGEEIGQRDLYRTQAECLQDWGKDPASCEPVRSGKHSGHYYGPYYRSASSRLEAPGTVTPPRAASRAVGTAHVARSGSVSSNSSSISRGGFGSSSATHSSSS